ncbi:hypothetical protein P7K49_026450, partial [Saguinus oedipus]
EKTAQTGPGWCDGSVYHRAEPGWEASPWGDAAKACIATQFSCRSVFLNQRRQEEQPGP